MERALSAPALASARARARRDDLVRVGRSTVDACDVARHTSASRGTGRASEAFRRRIGVSRRRARGVVPARAAPSLGLGGSWDHPEDEDEYDFHDPPTPNDWQVPGSPAALDGKKYPLGVVLTHVSADFDTLSSAVGLAKLRNHRLGAICTFVVLPRGASPGVAHYVQLHKNKFPIREKRAFPVDDLRWVGVVDAQRRDRLADCASWIDTAEEVVVLDHHVLSTSDINGPRVELIVENVGATATVVAEMLEKENVPITEEDATLLGLGIHADTGSLTFEATTPRDAKALAYCLAKGASQKVIAEYSNPSLTPEQREVIAKSMRDAVSVTVEGLIVSSVHVECSEYTPGMATCAKEVLDLTDSDVLLMAVSYVHGKKNPYRHVSVIGRAKPVKSVDLSAILRTSLGGGGHPKAASAAFRMDQEIFGKSGNERCAAHDSEVTKKSSVDFGSSSGVASDPRVAEMERARVAGSVEGVLEALVRRVVEEQIPPQKTAKDVMRGAKRVVSAPPDMTMGEVGELLERNDHRSCPVISKEGGKDGTDVSDSGGVLLGVVSITEVDVAAIKGQLDRPVSGYMKLRVAVTTDTPVSECERILVEQGEGCIPVVENYDAPRKEWRLAGLVTRATLLKTHEYYRSKRLTAETEEVVKKTVAAEAFSFPRASAPGFVDGEAPPPPRVTFDEHLFFSQDDLKGFQMRNPRNANETKEDWNPC